MTKKLLNEAKKKISRWQLSALQHILFEVGTGLRDSVIETVSSSYSSPVEIKRKARCHVGLRAPPPVGGREKSGGDNVAGAVSSVHIAYDEHRLGTNTKGGTSTRGGSQARSQGVKKSGKANAALRHTNAFNSSHKVFT